MLKASITPDEIALIKAMQARGMKTKDIQFFFNRPDRPVNSGRMANIKKGAYAKAAATPAADDATLNAFLAAHQPTPISAAVAVPQAEGKPTQRDPISDATLRALFAHQDARWRLKAGESDEHECKSAFGLRYAGKWLRAVAALANNRGGYLLFGVHDKDAKKEGEDDLSYTVIGLANSEYDDLDTVKITELLKSTFDPTPRIQKTSVVVDGKKVGVLHVDQHPSRPVIATKQADDIREGDIFFRYPAQSSRIKYSDLRAMLDARDRLTRLELMPMVERLIALGPDKVLLADLEAGALGDGRHVIQLDPALVERLKFIKEGEFREKDGAPALKLLGEVQSFVGAPGALRRGFATMADLIADFLTQETPIDPKEYIRAAVEGTSGAWVPIHYFARKAELDRAQLVACISGSGAPASRRSAFVARAQMKKTAYRSPSSPAVSAVLAKLDAGELPQVTNEREVARAASAIQGLKAMPAIPLNDLLGLLGRCTEVARNANAQSTMSIVRRAICRIDELAFG